MNDDKSSKNLVLLYNSLHISNTVRQLGHLTMWKKYRDDLQE